MKAVAIIALLCVIGAVVAERQVLWNRAEVPEHWSIVGVPSALVEVSFIVALPQRNLNVLEDSFWAISNPKSPFYRQFLTNEEIDKIIAPLPENKKPVLDWLAAEGVRTQDRGDAIKCYTTVANAERIFKTKLFHVKHFQRPTSTIRQLGEFSIPAAIAPYVEMITGLSDFPPLYKNPKLIKKPEQGGDCYIPGTVDKLYNVPDTATAPLTTQGVIEFQAGEDFSQSDLQSFAQQVGVTIPAVPAKNIHNELPPVGDEGTLDIQWIASFGIDSSNWYWTENNWLYDFGNNFYAATSYPSLVSISYGWAEYDQCTIDPNNCGNGSYAYVARVNTEFQKIGAKGVSLLVASGDSGANGRDDEYCTDPELHPDFPAACPYVTSVGATQINNPEYNLNSNAPICQEYQCVSGGNESAVSYNFANFASGGGFSNVAPRPTYQTTAVSHYLSSGGVPLPPASYYNASGRGYPDIASLGTLIAIYEGDEGGLELIGGTSASSPTIAGLMTLLNQLAMKKDGKPLGFLNPLLYQMYAECPKCFSDITVGDNKCTESGCAASCQGYTCAVGWDPVTGLGVPNVANMLTYVTTMLQ